jgi:hypothetical protein
MMGTSGSGPVPRRIESILVLGIVAGACGGAMVGFLYTVLVSVTSRSAAGFGDWWGVLMLLGAAIGVAVALPTGVVWIVLARPEHDVRGGARWGTAFTAFTSVLAISLALLQSVGGLAFACAAAAGFGAYLCGPLLGVWRSAP